MPKNSKNNNTKIKTLRNKGGANEECYDNKIIDLVRSIPEVCNPEEPLNVQKINKSKITKALLKYHPDKASTSIKNVENYDNKVKALTNLKDCFGDTEYRLTCTPGEYPNNPKPSGLKPRKYSVYDHPDNLDYIRNLLRNKNTTKTTTLEEGFVLRYYDKKDVESITDEQIYILLTNPEIKEYYYKFHINGIPDKEAINNEIIKVRDIITKIIKYFTDNPNYKILIPLTLSEINEFFYKTYNNTILKPGTEKLYYNGKIEISLDDIAKGGLHNVGANVLLNDFIQGFKHTLNDKKKQTFFNIFYCHNDQLFIELGKNIEIINDLSSYINAMDIVDRFLIEPFYREYFKSYLNNNERNRIRKLIIDSFNENLKNRSKLNEHKLVKELQYEIRFFQKDRIYNIQNLEKLGNKASFDYQLSTKDFIKIIKNIIDKYDFGVEHTSPKDRYRIGPISFVNPITFYLNQESFIHKDNDIYTHLIKGWNNGVDLLNETIKQYTNFNEEMSFKIENVEQEKLTLESFHAMKGGRKKRTIKKQLNL